jgi:AraC-like DNA-binding protein
MRRRIRLLLGESVQKWLDQLRLERAKELLPYTVSIKELSYFLAYRKPSHFSRQFKSHVGLTPSQFIALDASKRILF